MTAKQFVMAVLIELDEEFDDTIYGEADETIAQNLTSEEVKVKSGEYENLVTGTILNVRRRI